MITGTVKSIEKYGVFVTLKSGASGLTKYNTETYDMPAHLRGGEYVVGAEIQVRLVEIIVKVRRRIVYACTCK